ncbi:hypothetical protein QQG74_10360 [Micromonospora sp. FIMYZ51]|uniref:hypothetical protein n=1 Tax=Micromonospora sp. FIMYZ51 TaxID=3051832 RepID=UPI00311F70AA
MKDDHSVVWTLHRRDDDQVLAELVVTGGDFPWLDARVQPRDGLAELRPLFAEQLRRLDGDTDVETSESAYEAIRKAVTLRYPEGDEVPEFILHIDGDAAWWRWHDEPFDQEDD